MRVVKHLVINDIIYLVYKYIKDELNYNKKSLIQPKRASQIKSKTVSQIKSDMVSLIKSETVARAKLLMPMTALALDK